MSTEGQARVLRFPGIGDLAEAVAEEIAAEAHHQVGQKGLFSLALSGGQTPRTLFEVLALDYQLRLPWERTYVFWVDERFVSHNVDDSNYKMARDTLLSRVDIPEKNIFPVDTGLASSREAARAYEVAIRAFFGKSGLVPAFDLALLGLGADGHIASLFPESSTLKVEDQLVVSARAPSRYSVRDRVTLTLPMINQSRRAFILLSGGEKKTAFESAVDARAASAIPASLVRPVKELVWFVAGLTD
ncbi:MAG: 6-phosphogluconolactonase [Terriglobia bacterium]